jgi:hypothetical protein
VKWTHTKLSNELVKIGLTYSAADIDELNGALHAAGIVEDVAGEGTVPE